MCQQYNFNQLKVFQNEPKSNINNENLKLQNVFELSKLRDNYKSPTSEAFIKLTGKSVRLALLTVFQLDSLQSGWTP